MHKNNKAFTLVELIVVITIIAILWTIAFISLQWYSLKARDSRRTSDVSNIKTSLELFVLNASYYPEPDNAWEVYHSWWLLWKQWTVWDNVSTNLSRNLQAKPIDPLTEVEYVYSTIYSKKEYELLSIYESDIASNNNVVNQTSAANGVYTKIDWTYNWLYIKTPSYFVMLPSIITSEDIPFWTWLILTNANIKSQIITNWDNVPARWQKPAITWWIEELTLQVYTWTITDNSSPGEKKALAEKIRAAYAWTVLAHRSLYKTILDMPDDELEELINNIVLKWKIPANDPTSFMACESSTIDWVDYSEITYNYAWLDNWETVTWNWSSAITDWTKNYTWDISCDDWEVEITNEIETIDCDPWFIEQWWVCVVNDCLWTIVTNWTSNALTETSSSSWTYNETPWVCTFICNATYHWDWDSCESNTQIVACWLTTPSYTTPSWASTYTQTWNWSIYIPTTSWWEDQATCDFDCITDYHWDWDSCEPDVIYCMTQWEANTLNSALNASYTPEEWCDLNFLDRSYSSITTLPSEIWLLTNLWVLDLSFNQITIIPSSISNLTNLTYLNLTGNMLNELPDEIWALMAMEELYLGENTLYYLPPNVYSFGWLRILDLWWNNFSSLPDQIWNFTNLLLLQLEGLHLTELPNSIWNLTNLQELYIMSSDLTSLPSSITNLWQLQVLNLNNNPGLWNLWTQFDIYSSILSQDNITPEWDTINIEWDWNSINITISAWWGWGWASLVPILTGESPMLTYSSYGWSDYAWKAFDWDVTFWNRWWVDVSPPVDPNPWIQYAFPEPKIVTSYTITPCESGDTMAPNGWVLESSDDGENWTVIDSRVGEYFGPWIPQTFNISAPFPAFAYRLTVNDIVWGWPGSYMMIWEIEYFGY
jgi:prepilin-type N-terminal cleavage/methylation domain-containing protein